MSKKLSLSIIIPVYNEEDYIEDCLRAIAAQSEAPDEVIVIDNNSTDRTVELARKFPFVKIVHEKKQGLFFSRNAGVAAAKSDIVAKIDGDTRVDVHWVKTIKDSFMENAELQALTGSVGYHDMPLPKVAQKLEHPFLVVAKLLKFDFLFGPNMAFRKSAWQKILPELCNHPSIFEDTDIAIHMKRHGMTPGYNHRMSVLVSARRFADSPLQFMRYIDGYHHTFHHHGMRSVGAYFSELAFTITYFLTKPLYMAFDPKTRRLSIRRFFGRKQRRPDPMDISQI